MISGFKEDVGYCKANNCFMEFCSTEESQPKMRWSFAQLLQKNASFEKAQDNFSFSDQLPSNGDILRFLSSRLYPGCQLSKKDCIYECTTALIDIWKKADCCPKSKVPIEKKVDKLWLDFGNRRKKDPQHFQQLYPLAELFDIVTQESLRANFDHEFYSDQKSKRLKCISEKINPAFVQEQQEQERVSKEKEQRRASQYSNFEESTVQYDDQEPELDCLMDSPQKESSKSSDTSMEDCKTPPKRIHGTRSRSGFDSRTSIADDQISIQANKYKCGLNCHITKPICQDAGNQTCDITERQKGFENDQNWPLRPVRGLSGKDGKFTHVDPRIYILICETSSMCKISIKKSLKAAEIFANFFHSPWYQGDAKPSNKDTAESSIAEQDASEYLASKKMQNLSIENFKLPNPTSVRRNESILALGTERALAYQLMESSCATLHDDGTRKREVKGCIHGNQLTIDGVSRYLPPRLLAKEDQKTVVENIGVLLERLSTLSGHEKNRIWAKITALMTDLASKNHGPAEKVADHIQSSDTPGRP